MKIGYEQGIGAWYDLLPFEQACGSGSFPGNNVKYTLELKQLLIKNNIKKVVDYGCGNLETYKGNINFNDLNIEYVGYEANKICLRLLKLRYEHFKFLPAKLNEMPTEDADGIIIKDVLIHWFFKDVKWFFANVFERYENVFYYHSTTEQGYSDTRNKREAFEIKNPKNRIGVHKGDELPKGFSYHDKGLYGYRSVPFNLLPKDKIVFNKNIMNDSMKKLIHFKR